MCGMRRLGMCRLISSIAVLLVSASVAVCARLSGTTHLLKQGRHENGTVYVYSPYILWNEDLYEHAEELSTPLAIKSVDGVLEATLSVEAFRFEDIFSFNTRAFCHNGECSIPGPTIYCRPGDEIRLVLENKLLNDSNSTSIVNTTNIFIHGPPVDNSQNNPYFYATATAGGGKSTITYSYKIPVDAAPGVHFYLSRVRGVSALHVMGGLLGAFVIEPVSPDTFYPTALLKMRRELLVFSHIMLSPDDKVIPGAVNDRFSFQDEDYESSALSFTYLSQALGSQMPIDAAYNTSTATGSDHGAGAAAEPIRSIVDAWFTNGKYQPHFQLQPGEWVIFDLLVASGDRILEIEVRDSLKVPSASSSSSSSGNSNSSGSGSAVVCEVRVLALDGRYLPTARSSRTHRSAEHLVLLQASRATIALMCPLAGQFYLQSTAALENPGEERGTNGVFGVGNYQTKSIQNLLTINVAGATLAMEEPPLDQTAFAPLSPAVAAASVSKSGENADVSMQYWSISTAQSRGLSLDVSVSDLVSCVTDDGVSQWVISGYSSGYSLGMGRNCQLPCYDDASCRALQNGGASSLSSSYSVTEFPSVSSNQCAYLPFSGYLYRTNSEVSASSELSSKCPTFSCLSTNASAEAYVYDAQLLERPEKELYLQCLRHKNVSNGAMNTEFTLNSSRLQEITVFGHRDFSSLPLQLQGQSFEIVSHKNAETNSVDIGKQDSIANIALPLSEEYPDLVDFSLYGDIGDVRDTLPALTGKTVIRTHFTSTTDARSNSATRLLLMTSFLKFEDKGFTSSILIAPPSFSTSEASPTDTTDVTAVTSEAKEESAGAAVAGMPGAPPRSAVINPSSAPRSLLCDVSGASYSYNETIDLARRVRVLTTHACPNHFSVCQSASCGGPHSTRALIHRTTLEVPLYPVIAVSLQDTTCSTARLGVAVNGVGIYSMSDGKTRECKDVQEGGGGGNYSAKTVGRTSCERNGKFNGILFCGDVVNGRGVGTRNISQMNSESQAIEYIAGLTNSFDKCGGWVDDTTDDGGNGGVYKYHLPPTCLLQQLVEMSGKGTESDSSAVVISNTNGVPTFNSDQLINNMRSAHSPQIGWALDGFPIFGPFGPRGIKMAPCASPSAHFQLCLDPCNGYYGSLPGYDAFLYRYYIAGDVGTGECAGFVRNNGPCTREESPCCLSATPHPDFQPYTIGCFKGCPLHAGDTFSGSVSSTRSGTRSVCKASGAKAVTASYVPSVATFPTTIYSPTSAPASVPASSGGGSDTGTGSEQPNSLFSSANSSSSEEIAISAAAAQRKIATRNPFDRSISITSTTLEQQQQQSGSTKDGVRVVRELLLPTNPNVSTSKEAFITGMDVDPHTKLIYYTTQSGIYSFNEITKETTLLIAGLLEVTIFGYNLGKRLQEVNFVKINGSVCSTVVHISSELLTCLSVSPLAVDIERLSDEDVQISTLGGITRGEYSQPLSVLRSKSGRPIISKVEFRALPFNPYAIKLLTLNLTAENVPATLRALTDASSEMSSFSSFAGLQGVEKTLYWSNIGGVSEGVKGGYSIQRSSIDGTRIETVVSNVQRALGLEVIPSVLDRSLLFHSYLSQTPPPSPSFFHTPLSGTPSSGHPSEENPLSGTPSSGRVSAVCDYDSILSFSSAAAAAAGSTPIETWAGVQDCVGFGHTLLFTDAMSGSLFRVSVPPISLSQQVVFRAYDSTEALTDHTASAETEAAGKSATGALFSRWQQATVHSAYHIQEEPRPRLHVISTSTSSPSSSSSSSPASLADDDRSSKAAVVRRVLTGLPSPRAISVDYPSRLLFLTLLDGIVLRIGLDQILYDSLLNAEVSFQTNGAAAQLTGAIKRRLTFGNIAEEEGGDRNVFEVSGFPAPVSATIEDGSSFKRDKTRSLTRSLGAAEWQATSFFCDFNCSFSSAAYKIDVMAQLYKSSTPFPFWIKLILKSGTQSRLQGVAVLPILPNKLIPPVVNSLVFEDELEKNDTRMFAEPWQQQRVIVADANRQSLHVLTDNGFSVQTLDFSTRFGLKGAVVWPSVVVVLGAPAYSSPPKETDTFSEVVLYVSESLGRVWRVRMPRDTRVGQFDLRSTLTPDLVLDLSQFTASSKVRSLAAQSRTNGLPSMDRVFFELNS